MSDTSVILERIRAGERGRIFFLSDFSDIDNQAAVRKRLSRLCADGEIIRYGRGIYYYPVIDRKWGLGVIPATNEAIAEAYSRKTGISLYHSRAAARNILGLSTQNQMNAVYLTNGRARRINTGIGNGITLLHTGDSRLSLYRDRTMLLVTIALRGLSRENISDEWIGTISRVLLSVRDDLFFHDFRLMPRQTRLIVSLCKKMNS